MNFKNYNNKSSKISLFKKIIICSCLSNGMIFANNPTVFASSEYTNITNKTIYKGFGGSDYDYFNDVAETSDGGTIAVGGIWSSDSDFNYGGEEDGIIVKLDKNNNTEWINSFGGSDEDALLAVAETSDGGFVAVGYCSSTGLGFNHNGGYYDAILVKYNKDGTQEWVKNFGGNDWEEFNSISIVDDNIIVSGYSYSTNAGFANKGQSDAIVAKFTSDGDLQWIKNFGGSNQDFYTDTTSTSDKGVVAVGNSKSTNAGFSNAGGAEGIIVKYDENGNQLWVKNFGGAGDDKLYSVIETSNKDLIITGFSNSTSSGFDNNGKNDAYIIKYDKDGNQQWIKSFGGSENDVFSSVLEAKNGEIICVGSSKSSEITSGSSVDGIVVTYDENGNQLNVKIFGDVEYDAFNSVYQCKNGDLIFVGECELEGLELTNYGNGDSVIIRYNEEYEPIFEKIESIYENNYDIDMPITRDMVNKLPENIFKDYLSNKLNNLPFNSVLESKMATANLDLYIKSENMLSMNLSTNQITFEDYSGVDDLEKLNALEISINSSLPYQLNAYLIDEIYNSDKSKKIDMDRLNIKDNEDIEYKQFTAINDKLVIKDNCNAGNDLVHNLDFKLNGGNAYEADIYKTVIRFEAEQK